MRFDIGQRVKYNKVPGISRYAPGTGVVTDVWDTYDGSDDDEVGYSVRLDIDGDTWSFGGDNLEPAVVAEYPDEQDWRIVTEAERQVLQDVFDGDIEFRVQARIRRTASE